MYRSVNDPKRISPYDLCEIARHDLSRRSYNEFFGKPCPYPVLMFNDSVIEEVKELFIETKLEYQNNRSEHK